MSLIRANVLALVSLTWLTMGVAYGQDRPVIAAAKASDSRAVAVLLKKQADVNATEADGTTALHWAATNGDTETASLLIRAGANVTAINRYGVAPIQAACASGNAVMIDVLLKAGADPNSAMPSGETVLMGCARTGSVEALRALLDRGAAVNVAESWRGQTALMWAAANNRADAVALLLERGADLRARSKELRGKGGASSSATPIGGYTAFHFAVREGALDAVKVLVRAGAAVGDPTPEGTSPLVVAILNGHFELAAFLLDQGADPNAPDALHGSALHALEWVRRPVARSVGMGSGNVYPRMGQGNMDSLTLATRLLEKGANPNVRMAMEDPKYVASPNGTPTYSAKTPPNLPISAVSQMTWGGATPFWVAAKNADVPFMRLLVAHGADPLLPNRVNVTPLMAAAGAGFMQGEHPGTEAEALEATKLAIELGNDVNAIADFGEREERADLRFSGMTALYGAAQRGANSIVRLLVDRGARLDVKTREGWTAFNVADGVQIACCFANWPDTAKLLRQLMTERGLPVETFRYDEFSKAQ